MRWWMKLSRKLMLRIPKRRVVAAAKLQEQPDLLSGSGLVLIGEVGGYTFWTPHKWAWLARRLARAGGVEVYRGAK